MTQMTNFLQETTEDITNANLNTEDIVFIGCQRTGHSCTWEQFKVLANFQYDAGYGGNEIDLALIVVFKNGAIMRRYEYDGSEWWVVYHPFVMPSNLLPLSQFTDGAFEVVGS
jgi:hypothetical protein